MANPWFESVAEAQRRARKVLPKSVYSALLAGSERGVTVEDNVNAFGELGFAPYTAGQPAVRDLSTHVMGQDLALPVLISPTGVQAVHPDGELAVARAAANRGTAMGLSSFASKPVEEIVAANPKTFFQIYWSGSRDVIEQRLDRARAAGCVGLIATLDWSFSMGRDWGSPHIPEYINFKEALQFAPQALARPRWLAHVLRTRWIPDLTVPNMQTPGQPAPTFFGVYGEWMQTPPPSWDDVGWLRKQWDGPFMIKGITRVDEARRAVDAGATAMSVSNHGGNNLDGTPATIRILPAIADAVGHDIEVLLDGGIRRGSDVIKALALGELSLLDPGPRNSSATVVAEAHLARLDKASLERWILQRPDIALRILHVLARRLRRTSSDLADTIFIDVPGRVAKQLLRLARQFGTRNSEGIQVVHDLRQAEIAQLVGASRETVNKALSDFAGRGWLRVDKGSVLILDPERLAGRAR